MRHAYREPRGELRRTLMSVLHATLFKSLHVRTGDGKTLDLGSPTTRSLFAYLLLNRERPTNRNSLAYLFWPRGTESAARRNLRQYLHRTRRALDEAGCSPDLLLSDGSSVQINPTTDVWLDVEAFRKGVSNGVGIEQLKIAVQHYKGELLEDIYEDWCQPEREALQQLYQAALERLGAALEFGGQLEEAASFALLQIHNDPFNESAHRRLMRLYHRMNDRSRAAHQYNELTRLLEKELGVEPHPETTALYEAIQQGRLPSQEDADAPARLRPKPAPENPPLVGRQSELEVLGEACRQARFGKGGLVLVNGESGVGKTRLVQEFISGDPQRGILVGTCHELEARTPYAPFRKIVENAIQMLPAPAALPSGTLAALAELAPGLQSALGLPAHNPDATTDKAQMLKAFIELLSSLLVQRSPLILVLDNLQWADVPTWEILADLSSHAASAPLVILGICRLEDLSLEQHRSLRTLERNELLLQLSVERLSKAETIELAKSLLPSGYTAQALFFQQLYQESEGNPFFVIEIVRALQESGRMVRFSGPRQERLLPRAIQQVIEARLDLLSPASQELLGAAATIGREFTFAFLKELSQENETEIIRHLENWVQRGMVREFKDGYDFSHDKIRQVAYNKLSRARRQYTHRLVAEALEHSIESPDSASLAFHYASGDQPLKALPYLIGAGEQALRVRSYHEAQQFGIQAVKLLGQLPGPSQRSERIDLNLQLAQAYAFSGELQKALEILNASEQMAVVLGDELRLAKIYRRLSQIHWLLGESQVSGDYAHLTLRYAEKEGDRVLGQAALRMIGRVAIALARFDDAIAALTRYIHLEDKPERQMRLPGLPIVYGYLGVAYTRVGTWDRGLEAAELGVRLAEEEGAPQASAFAKMQLAFVLSERHNWQGCAQVLQDLQDPLQDGDDMTPLGFMVLGLRGRALANLGRPEVGIQTIRPALEWAQRAKHKVFHYLPRIFLVEALLQSRSYQEALQQGELAYQQAQAGENRWAEALCLRLMAEACTQLPNPDWALVEKQLIEARDHLRRVRARPDLARTYLSLRRLYDRAGQIAWAIDCHFRATSIFEELGMESELRQAQGRAAGERRGAVVLPNLGLVGPNFGEN